jgi:hypothetical protein
MHFFFVQVYRDLKSCTSLLETVSLRVPASNLRHFSKFGVSSSDKHCPAPCVYAAKVMGKDLDIFAIGVVSLIHTSIYSHVPKIVNNICS